MDKNVRNAIAITTQDLRKILQDEYFDQLEGLFDILPSGQIAALAGSHLTPAERVTRSKIVGAIDYYRASGFDSTEAVARFVREAAFTSLNRFVALKMLEARELVQECLTNGSDSAGYREFIGLAPGVASLPGGAGYRLYLESLLDELNTDVKILFDRHDAASLLWPRYNSFNKVLAELNRSELADVWVEDETIGWFYQFFNSKEERQSMRDESQAPRTSQELAVRNQFFTPRYVVQFLVDNTLGRLWAEMYGDNDRLSRRCSSLVRIPAAEVRVAMRRDPRDLRIIDPACGSGHFLLYSFDVLLSMYEDAWERDVNAPRSELTGRSLREDYPDLELLRRAAPSLIVEHNLYGVDIDARCSQIAALALWLRVQRAYKDLGIPRDDRPTIAHTHVILAEPMPGDGALVDQFAAQLRPPLLGDLFRTMVNEMNLAGELGLLLQVKEALAAHLQRARKHFLEEQKVAPVLPGMEAPRSEGEPDLSGINDDEFFHQAEDRIVEALARFVEEVAGSVAARRRLFAGDAKQGIALMDVARTEYDVVLMNPPFGLMPKSSYEYLVAKYPCAYYDLAVSFMALGLALLRTDGYCGAITTRAYMLVTDGESFRTELALPCLELLVDLGSGVMDGAAVDASLQVMSRRARGDIVVVDLRKDLDKALELQRAVSSRARMQMLSRSAFQAVPGHRLAYDAVASLAHMFSQDAGGVEPIVAIARIGASTFDDERFLRVRWELNPLEIGSVWLPSSRTAQEFSLYYYPPLFTVKWADDGREVCARNEQVNGQSAQARQGSTHYGRPGLVFARRSSPSIAFRAHPAGCAFASNTGVVLPHREDATLLLQGFLNSTLARAAVNALSNRDSYTVGHIKKLRWPEFGVERARSISEAAARIVANKHALYRIEETDPWFSPREAFMSRSGCREAFDSWVETSTVRESEMLADYSTIDTEVAHACGVESTAALQEQFGLSDIDVLEPRRLLEVSWREWVVRAISLALGSAFGRWAESDTSESRTDKQADPFSTIPIPQSAHRPSGGASPIFLDDPGHGNDVVAAIVDSWKRLWPSDEGVVEAQLVDALGTELREWIASRLFAEHLRMYRAGKRSSPTYWQLSIPSGRFSVWLYLQDLSDDTLFNIHNEFVGPKLRHEEARLGVLEAEAGASPSARERGEIERQKAFVAELRAFGAELLLVAAVWHPSLDDGVLVNFCPLWRLVPQHKSWQKELKATWALLSSGGVDWSRLAMHLWPERVIPKCVEDRSLAVAHGLESLFWVADASTEDRWIPCGAAAAAAVELVGKLRIPAVEVARERIVNR